MSAPDSGPASTEPAEPIEPAVDITEPMPPPPPSDTPQTFKCEKCGATFTDEGSAAAHIQTCKGTEDSTSEDESQQQPAQPAGATTPPSVA